MRDMKFFNGILELPDEAAERIDEIVHRSERNDPARFNPDELAELIDLWWSGQHDA